MSLNTKGKLQYVFQTISLSDGTCSDTKRVILTSSVDDLLNPYTSLLHFEMHLVPSQDRSSFSIFSLWAADTGKSIVSICSADDSRVSHANFEGILKSNKMPSNKEFILRGFDRPAVILLKIASN